MSRVLTFIAVIAIAPIVGCGSTVQQSSPARQHELVKALEAAKRRDIARAQAPQIEAARRAERERHEAQVDAFFEQFDGGTDARSAQQGQQEVQRQDEAQLEGTRSQLRQLIRDHLLGVTWFCTDGMTENVLVRIDLREPRRQSDLLVIENGWTLVDVFVGRGEEDLLPGVKERFVPVIDREGLLRVDRDATMARVMVSDTYAIVLADVGNDAFNLGLPTRALAVSLRACIRQGKESR